MAVLIVVCATIAGGAAADTSEQVGNNETVDAGDSLVDTDEHTAGPSPGGSAGSSGGPECEDQGPLRC